MSLKAKLLVERIDWVMVIIYLLLCLIGIACIFSVEHRSTDTSFFMMSHNYTKQIVFFGVSLLAALIILLMDSKVFTSIPFLGYTISFFLLLLALTPLGKGVKGSHSWLNLGFLTFQPGELMKVFTALTIAKFLTLQDTNFSTLRHRLICASFAFVPALIIILQNETGLAIVYLSFFLAMYREGLPNLVIIIGFSVLLLTLATLLIPKQILFYILSALALIILYTERRQLRRRREILFLVAGVWFVGVLFSQLLVPVAFKHILKGYQVQRIYTMIGQEMPEEYAREGMDIHKQNASEYNVGQSKIAIASGGFLGKGFLNGTQTQYNWVPEQRTDFIFCTIGEQFGFVGSSILILIYMFLLLRIVDIGERQRSQFSRIYAYGVAGILFFHLAINVGMTIGLAPVIGIPLPLIS
ncbi:MAG TPA: rod shape-determining protein RodA, partial [Chitinophagaceae bacterium]|nr:rod shape-determining protein RodA [Chitinophagaceae bacterium]